MCSETVDALQKRKDGCWQSLSAEYTEDSIPGPRHIADIEAHWQEDWVLLKVQGKFCKLHHLNLHLQTRETNYAKNLFLFTKEKDKSLKGRGFFPCSAIGLSELEENLLENDKKQGKQTKQEESHGSLFLKKQPQDRKTEKELEHGNNLWFTFGIIEIKKKSSQMKNMHQMFIQRS